MGDFKTKLNDIQGEIKNNIVRVKKLLDDPVFKADNLETSKMKSNIEMSKWRLEDAIVCLLQVIKDYEESAAANAFDKAFESQEEPPS